MQQPISSSSPEGSGQARRRGLFSGKAPAPVPPYAADPRLEATLSAYQLMIQDRLEEGIRAIQHTANTLMHEIASEVWRTAGGDKDEVQARVLETLSRDQALRSLIAHSDERFQSLAVRTARLEDTLNQLAEQTRGAKEALARGADALADAASAPGLRGVEDIRERLDQVTHQIALAFETLAERDRAIIETVQTRVREHGEVVTSETGRIAQAMQAYVQQGVSAVGNLAGRVESQMGEMLGRVESQMGEMVAREDEITVRINQTVDEQMRLLGEQLQLMYERMTVDTVSLNEAITHQTDQNDQRIEYLSEHLQLMHDRIGMETRDTIERLESLEARTVERLSAGISLSDEALAAQSERIREISGSSAERTEQAIAASAERTEQAITTSAERTELSIAASTERTEQAIATTAERTEQAIATSAERTEQAIARSGSAMEQTGRSIEQTAQAIERTRQALDEKAGRIEETTRQTAMDMTRELNRTIESRVMGLAQLVRSDSETLRNELVRSASERDESMGQVLDEQLGRVSEALTSATRWTVEEMTRRVRDETTRALQGRLDEAITSIGSMGERNSQLIAGRLNEAMSAIDRNMVRMTDTLDTELDRLGRNVGERAAVAAGTAIERKFEQTTESLAAATNAATYTAATSIERVGAELVAAQRATQEQLAAAQRATEEQLSQSFDQKIAALAKMIRSDNQALAERLTVAADQEASKQALRAVKELQAQLPTEVMDIVERRVQGIAEQIHRDTQATTESVAKTSEMLAQKIEQMAAHIGQRYDDDIQIVIERMGDAMHALASLGRPTARPDRIELD